MDYIKILNLKNGRPTLAVKKVISRSPAVVLVDKLDPNTMLPFSFNNITRVPTRSIKDLLMAEE